MTGPDGNLGDIVIRRAVLDWVGPDAQVVAFVGRHPESWTSSMSFDHDDRLVRGGGARRLVWLFQCALGRSRPVLITDPGEVWVGRNRFPHHFIQLVVGLIIRARGGAVVIPPHAIAQQNAASMSSATLSLHRRFAELASVCLWREPRSYALGATGELVPDIAFADAVTSQDGGGDRRLCVVSLRGDRAPLPAPALDAIVAMARTAQLEIVTLAQVDHDIDRARELAAALGGREVRWDPEDPGSEVEVRAVYGTAQIVVSDRLHVLVLGLLAGAMPVELASGPERKIAAHFSVVGIDDISYDVASRSTHETASWLGGQLARREEAIAAAEKARERLFQSRERVQAVIHSARGRVRPRG